ncbi:hypothetical protein [Catenulispora subtropica]|uniref:Uncharacterized protein n=1 Tax=Catenulispora subtropica TaxID=450798 RepID=A0ABN2SA44_9ACTN
MSSIRRIRSARSAHRALGSAACAVALIATAAPTPAHAARHAATSAGEQLNMSQQLDDLSFYGNIDTGTLATTISVSATLPSYGGSRFISLGYTSGNAGSTLTYSFSSTEITPITGTVKVYMKGTNQVWFDVDYVEGADHEKASILAKEF